MLQRFLWANSGFGQIKDLSSLDDMPQTFDVSSTL